jgi:hypothetical protein
MFIVYLLSYLLHGDDLVWDQWFGEQHLRRIARTLMSISGISGVWGFRHEEGG